MISAEKEKLVGDILTRSIFKILPSAEALKSVLLSDRHLKIYIGADATGPDLHLGTATNFILLEKLRKLGHEVIVLFGDFTARIGDPTGKDAARHALSEKEVNENIKSWRKQIEKILDFTDKKNPAKTLKNSTWLSKLSFEKVVEIAANFTAQQMLERDMFEKRMAEKKPIYLHEFFYPLMQGYDSVAMDVDVEIGGSDQLFNMLVGRELQKKYNNKEKFVVSTTLLVNPKTGKKLMNKSEGGYIGLNDSSDNMFGKVMALSDEVIVQMFLDCTFVSQQEISEIKNRMEGGGNPKNEKVMLAEKIVTLYHGEAAARAAREAFDRTFSDKQIPESVPEVSVVSGTILRDVLVAEKIVSSKSDFQRLVEQGAISILNEADGGHKEKITDPAFQVPADTIFKIGSRRFIKIKIR